jgi:hypothetical protein
MEERKVVEMINVMVGFCPMHISFQSEERQLK